MVVVEDAVEEEEEEEERQAVVDEENLTIAKDWHCCAHLLAAVPSGSKDGFHRQSRDIKAAAAAATHRCCLT